MAKVSLGSARAKLRWARGHRDRLEAYISAAFESRENWAILSAEQTSETGEHVFRIAHVPDYSGLIEEVSLRVGDVVHGLRGALDHLAWQLACSHGPMTDKEQRIVHFPIHDDAARFQSNKTSGFYEADDWARVEEYQPFRRGNGRPDRYTGPYIHPLAHLQELSNTDKHRQLPVVLLTSSHFECIAVEGGYPPWLVKKAGQWTVDATKINEPNPFTAPPNFSHSAYVVEIGAEVVRFKLTSEFARLRTIEVAGVLMPSVALAERRSIVSTLDRIANFVELVIDEFEDQLRSDGRLAS